MLHTISAEENEQENKTAVEKKNGNKNENKTIITTRNAYATT